jgi:putative membrane protein
MAQAQTRLKDNGFTDVSELVKDTDSVWRGHAMKDGKTVAVAVDYKGNITAD